MKHRDYKEKRFHSNEILTNNTRKYILIENSKRREKVEETWRRPAYGGKKKDAN